MAMESRVENETQLSTRYQALIWSFLDSGLPKTALFYAERFFSQVKNTHTARHLYAITLLELEQTHSALGLVAESSCAGCLELKARCCTSLGRWSVASEALDAAISHPTYPSFGANAYRPARQYPDEAAMYCRQGNMAMKGNMQDKAVVAFQKALALNPLLWEAFDGLCYLGVVSSVDVHFPTRPYPIRRTDEPPKAAFPVATGVGFFTPETNGLFRPWDPKMLGTPESFNAQIAALKEPQPRSGLSGDAPTQQTRPLSSAEETGPVPKKMRTRPLDTSRTSKLKQNGEDAQRKGSQGFAFSNLFAAPGRRNQPTTRTTTGKPPSSTSTTTNAATRRSNRLLTVTSTKPTAKVTRRRQPTQQTLTSDTEEEMPGEPAYSPSPPNAQSPPSERSQSPAHDTYDLEVADWTIYDLMRRFAHAARALAVYDLDVCIQHVQAMTDSDRLSPYALSVAGRALFEKCEYAKAEKIYRQLRTVDPYRMWDMDVYSTLLWYLQKPVDLSFLAQELSNINSRSAQAWIAIGNLFSLQKERSQALTCFGRATQMDPLCAYAYTLSGHESIDEDLSKAINFFESALRIDPRHYNAWYGLGSCYMRTAKLRLAEYHYRKANAIHPKNAVLLGCVGLTLERKGQRDAALAIFDEAIVIHPDNALVRYRRSKILISMKRYENAINDLEYLQRTAPEESNVIFQLARVYRLVGDVVKSAQLLAAVRDIAPKNLNRIKKLLDMKAEEDAAAAGDDSMMVVDMR
ncbi:TPR-like protein [Cylindrobasidium torrendii FP15055 ss-10]|uniref:TPR-like protein n=1 Tax=Cylindrobasidium torrendii FP15055 ss-10 TaxID=1314674 RepID=A0A0D7B9V0_9AGAR|nr:TPR-like protein [Cylindrobasidium torrendii FP15055 ss-10]